MSWLEVVLPHLTEPLFSASAVARLHTLALYLPGTCQAILEVRLGAASSTVDLSVLLAEASQAERMAEAAPLPDHLRRFLALWAKPNGDFSPVSRLWLEFDLENDLLAFPVPTVCARLGHRVALGWLLDCLWPAMQGRALTRTQRRLARHCWSEIPDSASLLYAFSLLSRSSQAIRMEICGLDPSGSLLEYLNRIAPRYVAAVAPIAQLFEGVDRIHLSFDIASEILPRIGIEGSFPRRPEREPRWQQLLDRLTSAGLAAPTKRDATLAWPGIDSFWTAAPRWPLAEAGIGLSCVRGVSHVKVVCGPEGEAEAKVYLTLAVGGGGGL